MDEEEVDGPSRKEMTLRRFRREQQALKQFGAGMSPIDRLKHRRRHDPVLDFYGNPYTFRAPDPPPAVSEANRMELLNMSRNNRWFLFFNRASLILSVYELCAKPRDENAESFCGDEPRSASRGAAYVFSPRWQLDYDKTSMFQHLYTLNVDPIAYFSARRSQIKIDDAGCVKLCYVENLPGLDKQVASDAAEGEEEDAETV